ncbi:hypothetical protein FOA52_009607 [Chlamydomonas sp. UWO 241]|nr:hypothetical protein FOA52_009607 [Chlamydomonas sp. UWO 241]
MQTVHRPVGGTPGGRMSKQDMEASRLVFVYVQDAKPKRKVAVPVPDGYTWLEFLNQVRSKLRITGVKEVTMASTGHKVTSLDELQDIDELCVVEGAEPTVAPPAVASTSTTTPNGKAFPRQQSASEAHKISMGVGSGGADDQGKYRERPSGLKRALQKLVPSLFSPGLPVTNSDTGTSGGSGVRSGVRRRRGGRLLTLRTLLMAAAVVSCIATMLWLTLLSTPKGGAVLQT